MKNNRESRGHRLAELDKIAGLFRALCRFRPTSPFGAAEGLRRYAWKPPHEGGTRGPKRYPSQSRFRGNRCRCYHRGRIGPIVRKEVSRIGLVIRSPDIAPRKWTRLTRFRPGLTGRL